MRERIIYLRVYLIIGLIIALTAGCAHQNSAQFDLNMLKSSQIIIIGEVHDDPAHHKEQERLVKLIQPKAIVFEMIPRDKTELLAKARRDGLSRNQIKQLLNWDELGWRNFDWYAPIMEAAPEAKVYGAGHHSQAIQRAFKEGAAAVFGEQAEKYGLTNQLPKKQKEERLKLQNEAHCGKMPKSMLPSMIEVQRLRDAGFARITLKALEEKQGPVVLITGNGHAREDWGVPAFINYVQPEVSVLAITQESSLERDFDPCDSL